MTKDKKSTLPAEVFSDMEKQKLVATVQYDVLVERGRQNNKWGWQRHAHGDWLMILTEEVGEVAEAMQQAKGWGKDTDADNLYEELIHVAAVASAIAEQVLEEKRKRNIL
ncbi:MazG-like family protein [Planococcus halocryophilus]|nr:MazG-like family protein [Planococcus halocryophilus]